MQLLSLFLSKCGAVHYGQKSQFGFFGLSQTSCLLRQTQILPPGFFVFVLPEPVRYLRS